MDDVALHDRTKLYFFIYIRLLLKHDEKQMELIYNFYGCPAPLWRQERILTFDPSAVAI